MQSRVADQAIYELLCYKCHRQLRLGFNPGSIGATESRRVMAEALVGLSHGPKVCLPMEVRINS